jgi:hypothetical protein
MKIQIVVPLVILGLLSTDLSGGPAPSPTLGALKEKDFFSRLFEGGANREHAEDATVCIFSANTETWVFERSSEALECQLVLTNGCCCMQKTFF